MRFNENLLRARKEKGISQETLAAQLNVTRQAVSKWETGESLPDIPKLSALADALGWSMDSLCGRELAEAAENVQRREESKERNAWKKAAAAFAVALLLAAGFFAGLYTGRQAAPADSGVSKVQTGTVDLSAPEVERLPDVITASAVSFSHRDGKVSCEFVPSVTGEGYTYRLNFKSNTGTNTCDAVCRNGICEGEIELTLGQSYTVVVTVSNGVESRAICLTPKLVAERNSVMWDMP